MSRLCEPFVEQSVTDKQRSSSSGGTGRRFGTANVGRAVDVEHPRDEGGADGDHTNHMLVNMHERRFALNCVSLA